MEDKKLNQLFIDRIRYKISDDKKLVRVLSDILNIPKDAVYRRLRNDAAFTFAEITDVAYTLNISVDHIIGLEKHYYPYHLQSASDKGINEDRIEKIKIYMEFLNNIPEDDNSEYAEVTTAIPSILLLDYDGLFRWYLDEWNYRRYYNGAIPIKEVQDFTYNSSLKELSKLMMSKIKGLAHCKYILNNDFLSDLTNEIKLHADMKSVDRKIIDNMKGELVCFLDYLEMVTISGCYPETGKKVSVYITDFNIHSGFGYLKSRDYNISILKLFALNTIYSNYKDAFEDTLNWFKSYEKLATPISVSNEIIRAAFFEEQRRIIDAL